MEDIYPEIALKQPKADPRTVLLYKRHFIKSSSNHIQDFRKNPSKHISMLTTNCDHSKKSCKYRKAAISAHETTTGTPLISSSSLLLPMLSPSSPSSISQSLFVAILVKVSKSCHFKVSFTILHKSQKTKLFFFLLFIWCAIFLQTIQAVQVRRVSTSGRKLILHTNIYRERYHQKLLDDRRHQDQYKHYLQTQYQRQLAKQQQLQKQKQQLVREQIQQLPYPIRYRQQVPGQILKKQHQQQPHHRHHLHQRAAPAIITSALTSVHHRQHKMSYCNGNKVYQNLHQQMNASMLYIKQLCANYLRDRGNETFESMSKTWKLISLEVRNPNRKQSSTDNELHKQIIEFYLNLHNFDQLIDYASQDTYENKTKIEHGEEVSIDKIIRFFQSVKAEIKFNMMEADNLLDILEIEKPNLGENAVEFNSNMGRRVRDFLIIKNLIEEFERILQLVQNYCENNNNYE